MPISLGYQKKKNAQNKQRQYNNVNNYFKKELTSPVHTQEGN